MECKIRFDISGTIEQKIVLTDKKYTEQDLINGLKSGNIVTTISHFEGKYKSEVIDLIKDKKIGYVKNQISCDNSEEKDYELI